MTDGQPEEGLGLGRAWSPGSDAPLPEVLCFEDQWPLVPKNLSYAAPFSRDGLRAFTSYFWALQELQVWVGKDEGAGR